MTLQCKLEGTHILLLPGARQQPQLLFSNRTSKTEAWLEKKKENQNKTLQVEGYKFHDIARINSFSAINFQLCVPKRASSVLEQKPRKPFRTGLSDRCVTYEWNISQFSSDNLFMTSLPHPLSVAAA